MHKNTVFKLGCGMFVECCYEVAREFPDVTVDEAIVDVLAVADIVFGPLVDAQEWPEGVDVAVIEGAVSSQDEDRILRAFRGVIRATLRTNYYQRDDAGPAKPYMSFKLDAKQVPELPLPRPEFEIFVYSPRVEGVHLRGGDVAENARRLMSGEMIHAA